MTSSVQTYPFLHLGPGVVCCNEALVTGSFPIRLGAGCIVHPRARLDSTLGPLTLGANCVLEELSLVRATSERGLTIGDWNTVRVGAVVEGSMGSACVVECRAHITESGSLGDGCLIGATCVVQSAVAPHTVMLAGATEGHATQRRRPEQEHANIEDVKAKELLRELLTKTHRLMT